MTTFSVLICTFNRHELLHRALNALIEETIEKPDEIILINAGDEKADIVINYFLRKNKVRIQFFKTENLGPAGNRNFGLPLCTGDIVAITDDDAEVFPDWVIQHKRIHAEHPEAGAIGGAVLGIDNNKNLINRLIEKTYFPSSLKADFVQTLPTVNISYKREIIEKVGLFDQTLLVGEDVDYNWRVQRLGFLVYYDPDVKVKHHNHSSLRKYISRQFTSGQYYYLIRKKWPEMYCVYPRDISRAKDLLKLIYFIVSTLSDPFISAMKMPTWLDRILALPLLYILHIAWKSGMTFQKFGSDFTKNHA